MTEVRAATHSGSWYSNDSIKLDQQLEGLIRQAPVNDPKLEVEENRVKGIIAPHAGYFYSSATASHAYKNAITNPEIKRVFIMGPSHHAYLEGCGLTPFRKLETPFGHLSVDQTVVSELANLKGFSFMDGGDDEEEHSIEMQLPFVHKCFARNDVTVVPIVVGGLSSKTEKNYAKIFKEYVDDPQNLFVVSSDFCHWGRRFSYTNYDSSKGEIHQSIQALDRDGMQAISSLEPGVYSEYQSKTKNTICGRHAISVLLNACNLNKSEEAADYKMDWVHYTQSSKAKSFSDSSVSYAAGVLYEF